MPEKFFQAIRDSDLDYIRANINSVDINAKDKDGNTALHIATNPEIIENRNYHIHEDEYDSVEEFEAEVDKPTDIIELILSRKDLDKNAKNNKGKTFLHNLMYWVDEHESFSALHSVICALVDNENLVFK